MTDKSRTAPWLWADFEKGQQFHTQGLLLDAERRALWEKVYGPAEDGAPLPEGMVLATMMQGYIRAIQPRPPGNLHAAQRCTFNETLPPWGATLDLSLTVSGKWQKNGRNWVTFAVHMQDGATPVMNGEITTVWAQ